MGEPGNGGTREELLSRMCLAVGCGPPSDGHPNSGSVRGWRLAAMSVPPSGLGKFRLAAASSDDAIDCDFVCVAFKQ